ncbi:MAG TPA: ammonium transporter, partial [Thermopetrobacter sp.]|nr:ammonium transporter [Thermopetrobacter sp.]
MFLRNWKTIAGVLAASLLLADPALAEEAKLDTGNTAWMLTSTALVLMMTIPGLALFYGGMVRRKNVLATMAQSFAITALVTVLWMVAGYSIAFGDGGSLQAFWGGLSNAFLMNMGKDTLNG